MKLALQRDSLCCTLDIQNIHLGPDAAPAIGRSYNAAASCLEGPRNKLRTITLAKHYTWNHPGHQPWISSSDREETSILAHPTQLLYDSYLGEKDLY